MIILLSRQIDCFVMIKISTFCLNNYKKYNNIVTYDKKKCGITKLY